MAYGHVMSIGDPYLGCPKVETCDVPDINMGMSSYFLEQRLESVNL